MHDNTVMSLNKKINFPCITAQAHDATKQNATANARIVIGGDATLFKDKRI